MESKRHKLLKKRVAKALERMGCENIEIERKIPITHYDHKHILRVDVCAVLNGLKIAIECGTFNPIDCPHETYLDPGTKLFYYKQHFDRVLNVRLDKRIIELVEV